MGRYLDKVRRLEAGMTCELREGVEAFLYWRDHPDMVRFQGHGLYIPRLDGVAQVVGDQLVSRSGGSATAAEDGDLLVHTREACVFVTGRRAP